MNWYMDKYEHRFRFTGRVKLLLRVIKWLSITLVIGCSPAAHANSDNIGDVGVVTVDGEAIAQKYFALYANRFIRDQKFICPPHSDAFVRDQVINLLVREKEYRLTRPEPDPAVLARIKKQEQQLANTDSRNAEEYLLNELYVLREITSGMRSLNYKKTTDAEIIARYQTMIKNKQPALTDVVVVRRYVLKFFSENDANRVQDFLDSGGSFSKLISVDADIQAKFQDTDILDNLNKDKYQTDIWYAVNDLKHYEGDGLELKAGDVLGPYRSDYDVQFLYIEEQKTLSRIRPSQTMSGVKFYAREQAKAAILNDTIYGVALPDLDQLWNKHAVKLNGEPLAYATEYPACP